MISILIPAFNEEAIIENSLFQVHQYLLKQGIKHEIIVISNGSTDRTVEIVSALAAKNDWLQIVVLDECGVGRAFAAGVSKAQGDYIISIDADLSTELCFIDEAVRLLPLATMVVGSKTLGKQERSFIRVFASQIYILFTQFIFGISISDFSIGCKAYRRSEIVGLTSYLDPWTGYVFELSLYFSLRGHNLIQVGVQCDDKRKSHFNLMYEGYYRFRHLFLTYLKMKKNNFWINRSDEPSR